MAARVTLISKTDPSVRRTMLAVDAKELLSVDKAGEWTLFDHEAEARRAEIEAASKRVAEMNASLDQKREIEAAVNVKSTAAKTKKAAAVDPLA